MSQKQVGSSLKKNDDSVVNSTATAIRNDAAKFYNRLLLDNEVAMNYIKSRGITEETVKAMYIGYAPGKRALVNHLIDSRVDLLDGIDSYLIRLYNNEFKDYFNGYIMFPVFKGTDVVTFTARGLGDTFPKHNHMKGPGKKIYNSNVIATADTIIVVESPFNALSLMQEGYNVIATLGANSFNNYTAEKLKGKTVYIAYDNDVNKSGQKAAAKVAVLLYEEGVIANVITMPIGIDVNDLFSQNRGKEFYTFMQNSTKLEEIPGFKKLLASKNKPKYKNSYDKGLLENVLSIPIIEVVKLLDIDALKLGNNYKCVCPLPDHVEKEGSFIVYTNTNTVKCFGCGFFGDSISLVREMKQIGFKEAVKFLEDSFIK